MLVTVLHRTYLRREARCEIFTTPELVTARRSILGPPAKGRPRPSKTKSLDNCFLSCHSRKIVVQWIPYFRAEGGLLECGQPCLFIHQTQPPLGHNLDWELFSADSWDHWPGHLDFISTWRRLSACLWASITSEKTSRVPRLRGSYHSERVETSQSSLYI